MRPPFKNRKKENSFPGFYSPSFADFHSERCAMTLGSAEITVQYLSHMRCCFPASLAHATHLPSSFSAQNNTCQMAASRPGLAERRKERLLLTGHLCATYLTGESFPPWPTATCMLPEACLTPRERPTTVSNLGMGVESALSRLFASDPGKSLTTENQDAFCYLTDTPPDT